MKTYAEMSAELEQLAAHNDRLTAGLRAARAQIVDLKGDLQRVGDPPNSYATFLRRAEGTTVDVLHNGRRLRVATDRKSTRLNSSHVAISYAVFCLKKKTTKHKTQIQTN